MAIRRAPGTPLRATLVLILAMVACTPAATSGPTPSPEVGLATYTLCPPSGELPEADVNEAAIAVVEARLAALGIEAASVSVGSCLDVALDGPTEDELLRAVIFGTGLAEVFAVPPDRVGEVVAGEAPPDGLQAVLDPTAVAGATAGASVIVVRLTDPAASVISTWTTTHPGEHLALVLDGRVVGTVPIDGPNASGSLTVAIPAEAGLTPVAVVALLAAGPLPGDWRQPDAPQG